MAKTSHIKRRGSTYYAQIAVPLDLQKIIGRKTMDRSLRTKDPQEAKRLVRPVLDEWDRLFDEARRRRALTPADMSRAVWQHYTAELALDDHSRLSTPTRADIDKATRDMFAAKPRGEIGSDPLTIFAATLDVHVLGGAAEFDRQSRGVQAATLRRHLASGETVLIEWAADEFIARNDLHVEKGSLEYRDLCRRLQRAQLEVLTRAQEGDLGDYTGTPKDPIVVPVEHGAPQTATPGERILDLYDAYARENAKGISTDTLTQGRRDVKLFVDTLGDMPPSKIDKKAVRAWKGLLMDYPVKAAEISAFRGMTMSEIVKANEKLRKPKVTNRTVNRYLSSLGAFCDWLVRNDYLDQNPVTGLHQKVEKHRRTTQPFTVEQMNKLFGSPLFTGCQNDDDWHKPGNHLIRDHRYWLPLVMLYSGARPAEIAQLLVGDVREQHGQWIIHITESDDDDKSVKTKGSMRVVPVHSELIILGFIDYRNAMKAREETRVFPEAVRNQRGQMAADFSRDFGRYLTRIGLKNGRGLSLYSFRHGFIDALRRAEYLDEQFGFLVGHTGLTMTGQYGQVPQGMLRQRVEMVEKVIYPGLALSRLMSAR